MLCGLAERSGEGDRNVDELSLHFSHGGKGERFPMRVASLNSGCISPQNINDNDTRHRVPGLRGHVLHRRWSPFFSTSLSQPLTDALRPSLRASRPVVDSLGRCVPFDPTISISPPLVLGRGPPRATV